MKTFPSFLLVPLFFISVPAFADEKETAAALPLRDVALFSSGVGYFGRAGQIVGDARVDLYVKAPQISDLLKSLVLFDPQGTIKPVSYSLADWLGAQPLDTDLKVGTDSSPGAILRGFQGANVELTKSMVRVTGRILSVNEKETVKGGVTVTVEQITLLTSNGVETENLDDVTSFKLLDPTLEAKLMATLEKKANSLTQRLDDGARAVSLNFGGKGAREVRAGYLLETPAWKTSYRLVLGANKKPYLQGWAIVENTTDEDWKNVHLSLISGRPISFIQDLATPVYVARPIVEPLVIGSPNPQTFGEGFKPNESDSKSDDESEAKSREMKLSSLSDYGKAVNETTVSNGPADIPAASAGAAPASPALMMPQQLPISRFQQSLTNSLSTNGRLPMLSQSEMQAQGAKAQAQGEERGELFEYAIDGDTTLAHGEAAMVPIVSADIGGEALTIVESSLYRGEITASNGFYLRNSSGLHLQGGPITVFADGIYGGDALINNLSPNESRLISYAVDLELAALQNDPHEVSSIAKLSLSDGVLKVQSSLAKTRSWIFKNKAKAPKSVLLQVPYEQGWQLANPKQLEGKAAGVQRFRVTCPPGETKYSIKWVQTEREELTVTDESVDDLVYYSNDATASPALRAKLRAFVAGKRQLADLTRRRVARQATLREIGNDQDRIRKNMGPLDKSGQLFKSYEAKLGAQEGRIDSIRAEIERLQSQENATRRELHKMLAGLTTN